jgi:hypothetical protein
MINLAEMIKDGNKALLNKAVAAILLGPSGAGKSRTCGTFGVKTLYLHTSSEAHGAASAAVGGSEILPICIDVEEGETLSADKSYERLLSILGAKDQLKKLGIGAIALDGATEIENLIMQTSAWKARVASEYKGVASYAGPVTLGMFRPILTALQALQRDLGVHYIMTCILNVKELGENGAITNAEPKLKGFDVATGIVQQFPDVLVVGQVSDGDRTRPAIQLGAHVHKASKDFTTKEVRKLQNFWVRVTGADLSEAPDMLAPNLARIAEIKAAGKYTKKG